MKTVKVLHDVAYEGLRPNMQEEQEAATPDWLVFLMGKCWVNIPSERPSFSEILSFIEDEMRKMELEIEFHYPQVPFLYITIFLRLPNLLLL